MRYSHYFRVMLNPKFSILVPTRGRPENVIRLIESIIKTASGKHKIEVIFYIDEDDETFPNHLETNSMISVVRGKRVWISLAWNTLYSNSKGEIIMYSGDDVVFETYNWDEMVSNAFKNFPDNYGLVYGNDGGWYSGKLAINGFVHKDWPKLLGYLAYPARLSALDLWIHECAAYIGRVTYLDEVIIRHIHYRQGEALAEFDKTYQEAYEKSVKWGILETYLSLKRERRIDKVILSRATRKKIPIEFNYIISHMIDNFSKILNLKSINSDKIITLTNRMIAQKLVYKILNRKIDVLKFLS